MFFFLNWLQHLANSGEVQLKNHPVIEKNRLQVNKDIFGIFSFIHEPIANETRSSWLNCALRDDEAAYWVSRERVHFIDKNQMIPIKWA